MEQDILTSVQEPTPWVSSMVVVPKKDGKLRIRLDPRDLNKAIHCEHYPLPTIEDVATKLYGARVFTMLDVHNGFWHMELVEEPSFLTTFNTPFGRYRWKRMPFGISSAPEVLQSMGINVLAKNVIRSQGVYHKVQCVSRPSECPTQRNNRSA